MSIRSSEYDAFGPWIYLIDEEHTLPKLFEPYGAYLEGAKMLFKIPREIERRKANPDMHLYDAVVAVFEDYVLMLKRNVESVMISRVEMKDIVAVGNSHFLLLGKVTLYLKSGIFQIEYNTVSVEIIAQFVDLIRSLIDYEEHPLNLTFLEYDTNTIDYLFAHLVNEFRKQDDKIGLVAYQPKYQFKVKKDIISRIMEGIGKPQMITCIAFLANHKELVIINRASPLKSNDNDEYAYTYVYLPLKNVDDAEIWEKVGDENMYELRIKTFDHEFISNFNDSNVGIKQLKFFLDN